MSKFLLPGFLRFAIFLVKIWQEGFGILPSLISFLSLSVSWELFFLCVCKIGMAEGGTPFSPPLRQGGIPPLYPPGLGAGAPAGLIRLLTGGPGGRGVYVCTKNPTGSGWGGERIYDVVCYYNILYMGGALGISIYLSTVYVNYLVWFSELISSPFRFRR